MPANKTSFYLEYDVPFPDGVNFDTIKLDLLGDDGVQLRKSGYAPGVHQRRKGRVGGIGIWEDVEEPISLNISGETPQAVNLRLRQLISIIDLANTWQPGPEVLGRAPRLCYQVIGSTTSSVAIAYLVGGKWQTNAMVLDATFNDLQHAYELANVRLIIRRTPWMDDAEEWNGDTKTVPALWQVDFGSGIDTLSPLHLSIKARVNGYDLQHGFPAGLLAVAADPKRISLSTAASWNISANGALINDSANYSYGGNIIRHTTPANRAALVIYRSLTGFSARTVAVYAIASSTGEAVATVTGSHTVLTTRAQTEQDIPATPTPMPIYLGTLYGRHAMNYFSIAVTGAAQGVVVNFDAFILVGLDDASSRVVLTDELPASAVLNGDLLYTRLDCGWDGSPSAGVEIRQNADDVGEHKMPMDYHGRPDVLAIGQSLTVLWYPVGQWKASNGAGARYPYWRAITNDTTVMRADDPLFRRFPASIVPW